MDLKKELLVRSAIAIFLLFFVGKFIGPLILQYFYEMLSSKKNKRKNIEMDILVSNKEQLLRGENPKKSLLGSNDRDNSKKKKTENAYIEAAKKVNNYKPVLELFDCAKWGEGKVYQEFRIKFTKNFGFTIDLLHISKATNFLIKKDLPISLRTPELPELQEISEGLQTKIALELLLEESKLGSGKITDRLAKKYKVSPQSIRQAFETIIFESQGEKKEAIYLKLYSKKNSPQLIKLEKSVWDICCIKILLGISRERFTTKHTLFARLSKEAAIYENLTPFPTLNPKNDLLKAYKLFEVSKENNDAEIKKAYKKLAAAKHPDKMASAALPKTLEKVLHENFATIQNAYAMITKSRGSK